MTATDLYAEQAAADAELGGELFTADDEFPREPGRITTNLPDIADYPPADTPSPAERPTP